MWQKEWIKMAKKEHRKDGKRPVGRD